MTAPAKTVSVNLEITNKRGLHARASAKFARCAEDFQSAITVSKDVHSAAATSIMGLLTLGATQGSMICVEANGDDADRAIAALSDLVHSRFGED